MKLTRLRIEQFRQFRQPLEIRDLDAGLNLFAGPNEAGKSTIVAAIRAAFFERHRSGSVEDLRPWGDASAAPTIELEFETGGVAWLLHKSFLSRKRCTLKSATCQLDGADAEDRLAELFGFRYAGRGVSAAEHWGIPGLLWIQQGTAHDLRDPVAHATDHLRNALNASLGEVASSGGDAVTAEVEALRNALLTPSGGAPRGIYKDAIEKEAALAAALAEVDDAIGAYRQKVDRLAVLRREHEADEVGKPWQALREQEKDARARVEDTRALTDRLSAEQAGVRRMDDALVLLHAQLDGFARQEGDVAERRAAVVSAEARLADARARVAPWRIRSAEAARRCDAVRRILQAVRQRDARQARLRDLVELHRQLDTVRAALAQSEVEEARLRDAQKQMAETELHADDLGTLRAQQQDIQALRMQQAATATRLRFVLDDGRQIHIGDERVAGHGERLLTDATTIALPGLGRLDITPGGRDLADLGRSEAALCDSHAALLQRMGVESLAAAEARLLRYAQHRAEAQSAAATLKACAPQGLDALRTARARLDGRVAEVAQSLARLPCDADAADLPTLGEAESQDDTARASATDAARQLMAAEISAAEAQNAVDAARRELDNAQAILDAPDRAARLAATQRALTAARAEQAIATARIDQLAAQCRDARPDILMQDVERFARSAEQLEREASLRRDELTRLEVELQTAGAQGLDERRAEHARGHVQAMGRVAELRRRAAALDHLLTLLKTRRSTLIRRLQAPLQRHLDRYLQLIFPHASLGIADDLGPGPLTRLGQGGQEVARFEDFSFGAREQMGVISRLAYADLLREAGRATLLILDDALVHSDDSRLAQMKRVLFDAATRHQILLFTCHPEKWRDIGVGVRSIDALHHPRDAQRQAIGPP